jgi:outer membrane receptor protein involved in Fe transport
MPYGGVTNSAADINQIPTRMIERVDILTGGASAVYGSDAVAGVVNFIMKKDFEGVQHTGQYNFYWHENDFGGPGAVKLRDTIDGLNAINPSQYALPDDTVTDGEGVEASIVMGVNSGDGRGNITAYATVFDSKKVLQRDRDYSACSLSTAPPTVSFGCGGSATSAGGLFTDFSTYYLTADTAASFRDFDFGTDLYNFGPLNHYQRPERRWSIGAMGHYEFGEHADVYTQLMFNDYESIAQIAPGGNFFNTTSINCDNPLLPPGSLGTIGCDPAAVAAGTSVPFYIGRRNVEGGGRQSSFANSTFRMVAGLRGAINEAWGYDVSASYAQGNGTNRTLAFMSTSRLVKSLDVILDPDATSDTFGTPQCRSFLDGSDANCVPYNPFVPGGITQDQLDYLEVTGIQVGRINQEIYNAVVTGDLGVYGIKSPLASDGIQLVFGTEWRRDTLENQVDALDEAFDLAGTGGPTIGISGGTKVEELFMEARIPIAQDRAGMESLSFDTAYRYSDYGDGVQTDTYKFGLEWAPVQDVRLRGSYQKAVRAANIVELFTAQGFNLFDMTGDPCGWNVNTPNPATDDPTVPAPVSAELREGCEASGVPAANVGRRVLDSPAGQYNFQQGGNLDLQPEDSDTYSYGIVFTPRFAPGLALTVDYFDIKIDDTISTVGAENSLNACVIFRDPVACSRVNRNPVTGSLWVDPGNVVDLNVNIGSLQTKGYDLNVTYTGLEMGRFGSLNFNLTGTYVDEIITDPGVGGIEPYDCVGFYSSVCSSNSVGVPTPEWRHRFRTSWVTPWDLDLSLTWRHLDSVQGFGFDPARIDFELPSEDYFDLAANWAVTEKASVTLGINNVLDDNPSLSATVGTTGNGNTFPQTYDALGRYVFMRATFDF